MHQSKWLLRTALVGTLAMGLHAASPSAAIAQGVPVVDTQNIAQNIQQLCAFLFPHKMFLYLLTPYLMKLIKKVFLAFF